MTDENLSINDRRSGYERREMPPECKNPCDPIVKELNNRDEEFKKVIDNLDGRVHSKLDKIFTCLAEKIPSKLFWRIVFAGMTFVFIIIGGGVAGTFWALKNSISEIDTNVKVMAVTVNRTAEDMNTHIIRAEQKYDSFDQRLDSIERGDTYFNFHNREKERRNRDQ